MCSVVPGAFAGAGLEEKVLMRNSWHASPSSIKCVPCPVVPLHPGNISRPAADAGSLNKCL